jgi:hypothetical protein
MHIYRMTIGYNYTSRIITMHYFYLTSTHCINIWYKVEGTHYLHESNHNQG